MARIARKEPQSYSQAVSVPIRSTEDILAALREHPEWRKAVWNAFLADDREAEEIRKKLLTDDLLRLPSQLETAEEARKGDQNQAWEAIRDLADAQRKTDATLGSFMESTQAFQRSMEEFKRSMEEFKRSMEEFKEATEKRFRGIERELDSVVGESMEGKAKSKIGNYARAVVRKLHVFESNTINDLIDTALEAGDLSEEEAVALGATDILAAGKDKETGEAACVAAEISRTIDEHDVDRAEKRAVLLLKAVRSAIAADAPTFSGLFPGVPQKAYPIVIGRRITDRARREAERRGVLFGRYQNGYDRQGR